jgi:hypothetical protein
MPILLAVVQLHYSGYTRDSDYSFSLVLETNNLPGKQDIRDSIPGQSNNLSLKLQRETYSPLRARAFQPTVDLLPLVCRQMKDQRRNTSLGVISEQHVEYRSRC